MSLPLALLVLAGTYACLAGLAVIVAVLIADALDDRDRRRDS